MGRAQLQGGISTKATKDKRDLATELEEVLECHLFHDVLGGIVSSVKVQKAASAYRVSDH
jgi:hypothetical protein